MIIAGFQKNSTIDFPGKFSSVIFTANCNYDCYYCHNRHLLGAQEKVFPEEIFEFLEKRKGQIDGVAITGGEPTLYDDLPSFIEKIRSMDYAIKLDTNGSNVEMVRNLLSRKLVDFIAVDYKAPFDKYDYINATSDITTNKLRVTETIEYTMSSGVDYEIRTTLIPEITKADLIQMAQSFPEFKSFVLQKYRPVPEDPGEDIHRSYYKKEDIEIMASSISEFQPNIIVRA